MTEPQVVRWGILGPGNIAQTFTRNLLQRPPSSLRPTAHIITAIASSTSLTTAQSFIKTHILPHQAIPCTAYSSYASLLSSPDIDVIYIATPHSSHFRIAMQALHHNKPLLIEKPICVNATQASILFDEARKRGLFVMEALWTRFFPLTLYVQDVIRGGGIGEVLRVNADFSMGCGEEEDAVEFVGGVDGRVLNPRLAGGVLLDLGVYSLSWVFLAVWHLLPPERRESPVLAGAMLTPCEQGISGSESGKVQVDRHTMLTLTMPSAPSGQSVAHCVASTSLYMTTDPGYGGDDPSDVVAHRFSVPSVRIQGTQGEIQVFGPLPRPQRVRLFRRVKADEVGETVVLGNVVEVPGQRGHSVEEKVFESMGDGNGMYWEADEVARCFKDGKTESEIMPWAETLEVMRVMDEARRRCGLDYGEEVEGTN